MKRDLRQSIVGDIYTDVDMDNAHPVILRQLFKKYGIDAPLMDEYIDNREFRLAEIIEDNKDEINFETEKKYTRADAKQIFLSVINGGKKHYQKLPKKSKFLTAFTKEVRKSMVKLSKHEATQCYRDLIQHKKDNKLSLIHI